MKLKAILSLAIITLGCSSPKKGASVLWSEPAKLPNDLHGREHIGLAGPVVGMLQDHLLVLGGANFPNGMPWQGGRKSYSDNGYIYSVNGSHLVLKQEFRLKEAVAYPANLSLKGKLYFAGGENQNGYVNQVSSIELSTDGQVQQRLLSSLPVALSAAGMAYGNGRLFFIGGEGQYAVSDKVYSLDLHDPKAKWEEFTQLPYAVSHAIVVGDQKEKIYIVGGRKKNPNAVSEMYDNVLEMELLSGKIRELTQLPKALSAGTGVFYESKIYVFGGDDGTTFKRVEAAILEIENQEDGKIKEELIARKNSLQENHPGFSNENWAYDLKSDSWIKLSPFNGLSPVTTTAVLNGNQFFIPTGEVKAGVRTNQILIGEIK